MIIKTKEELRAAHGRYVKAYNKARGVYIKGHITAYIPDEGYTHSTASIFLTNDDNGITNPLQHRTRYNTMYTRCESHMDWAWVSEYDITILE